MANEKIIAVDCGKAQTKVCVVEPNSKDILTKISFPTRIEEYSELSQTGLTGGHHFKTADVDLLIGADNLSEGTRDTNSKNDDIHKYATLFAIASNVSDGDIVHVAIGCPLSEYADVQKRDAYKNAVIEKGTYHVEIDGKKKSFKIEKRAVFPESTGIIYLRNDLFVENSAIIDIGGLNINAVQVLGGTLAPSTAVTKQYGSKILYQNLSNKLESADEALQLADAQLIDAISKGRVKYFEEISELIIKECVEKHLDDAYKQLTGTNWKNVKTLQLVFVGGTSVILKDYIKKKFGERAVILTDEESRFANAEGFLKMFREQLQK